MLKLTDIHLRDPFVLPAAAEQRYYLYGTNHINGSTPPGPGFDAYTSADLENWEGPFPVFRPPQGFWADRNFWAPEVHAYRGKYYLFASFKAPGARRGTQALVSDSPLGPFVPHSPHPLTPAHWECLDGTFYVDEEGDPWIIFCREWVEVEDGQIAAQRLTDDLKRPMGVPLLLFRATDAPWVTLLRTEYEGEQRAGYVTDGPFFYRGRDGSLNMLWSSYGKWGYTQATARSATGRVEGPWRHTADPLFTEDGGHGMLFETFAGQRMLALHQPNCWPNERPRFLPFTG